MRDWYTRLGWTEGGIEIPVIDPGGGESAALAKRILDALPSDASAIGSFDWRGHDAPLVRIHAAEAAGADTWADPLRSAARYGEGPVGGPDRVRTARDADPLLPAEVVLEAAPASRPEDRMVLARGEWTADDLVGRQVLVQFVPTLETARLVTATFRDVRAFVPTLAVQGPDLTPEQAAELSVKGDAVTRTGDRIRVREDGSLVVAGTSLSGPEVAAGRVTEVLLHDDFLDDTADGSARGEWVAGGSARARCRWSKVRWRVHSTPAGASPCPGSHRRRGTAWIDLTSAAEAGARDLSAHLSRGRRPPWRRRGHRPGDARTPVRGDVSLARERTVPRPGPSRPGDPGATADLALDYLGGPSGRFYLDGIELVKLEGEPASPSLDQVEELTLAVDPSAFPELRLRAHARDADGEEVGGLLASDFRLEEESRPVGFTLTGNRPAPQVLILHDTSMSMPAEYRNDELFRWMASLRQAVEAEFPGAHISRQATDSDIWGWLLRAAAADATTIVYLTDGDLDGEVPDQARRAALGEGPPAVMVSVKDETGGIFQEMADATGGVVVAVSSIGEARDALLDFIRQREHAPYRFRCGASSDEPGDREVLLRTADGRLKARASYRVPEPEAPARPPRLGALYLTVTVGDRTVERTLAGARPRLTGAPCPSYRRRSTRCAMPCSVAATWPSRQRGRRCRCGSTTTSHRSCPCQP